MGSRRHIPDDRRLAPRRLDRPRARPAARGRVALRRRRRLPDDLQRAALLPPRLALAAARRPPLRPRRLGADRPRHARPARRRRDRGRAGRARGARGTGRGHAGVGPPAVGARRLPPPARAVGARTVARVVALVPDLLFGSQVQGMLAAGGHEVELVGERRPDTGAPGGFTGGARCRLGGSGSRRCGARGIAYGGGPVGSDVHPGLLFARGRACT